ncbi:MAG: glutamate synthase large subunit [Alphaproteobacteria bacterium]|nr:glutamate synthase large subunit [Alphaproteobacteria bacterium]
MSDRQTFRDHDAPRSGGSAPLHPEPHGLYDPQTEHDACGIGFIASIKGIKSHSIVLDALQILERLTHRGATGCDPCTGDGAGILVQISNRFFQRQASALGIPLPRKKGYAVGHVFLPPDPDQRAACEKVFEDTVAAEGQRVVGWRDVPIDPEPLGPIARGVMPVIRQVFVARRRCVPSAFNRRLYVIRKLVENALRGSELDPKGYFHVCSLSSDTIVYKGLLTPEQLRGFYPDLSEPDFVSAIAMVHSRFSTNTFPTWDLAQPFRFMCHNGEINTLRGNRNWMLARKALLQSAKFPGGMDRLWPIIVPGKSDSAQFDNMVELLHLGGRTLPHAMMMMIPEAFEGDALMEPERRAFYDYASNLMEPWDGPAAICFTDGFLIGATLDRNGLRPARYLVTTDDRVVLSSETGVVDIPPEMVRRKGRLKPGRMLLVDTIEKRIIDDDEAKAEITNRFPYRRWLERNGFHFADLPPKEGPPAVAGDDLVRQQRAFGWTDEDLRVIVEPMARDGKEPTGSMGNDTPLAVLSDRAPSLFGYVKQLFAQVTNPPIDPIRERLVMSLRQGLGGGGNTFDETPEQCHRLTLDMPVLTNAELATLEAFEDGTFETKRLDALYDPNLGPDALDRAVKHLCRQAEEAVDEGHNILVISDRGVDARWVPIPALLAASAVHQHLVRTGTRLLTGLVIETAEAREVHHFACLLGFGAGAVNPWLALDTVAERVDAGVVEGTVEEAHRRYLEAVGKGLLKIMSKMGISTMGSYGGAQIFEIVGLDKDVVDTHFTGTPSRIRGVGLAELDREARMRHQRGFSRDAEFGDELPTGGIYQWRRRGELHKWNPSTIAFLQRAVREEDREAWKAYTDAANGESDGLMTLRGMLHLHWADEPVPLDEVEPASAIVKRFCTGAMSFGSISAEAHETLAIAMNKLGGRSNSGEGGEESRRFTPDPNGDERRSAIKQVASGRFGVHAAYLANADELQIKVAQGAKPGEGGQLPGHKVSERIAKVRWSTPGVTLISPPPHHDIYSIEDLAQLIHDLHVVNPEAEVSVKLVSEVGVGTVAAGVSKARADRVIIAGDSGGTGASPVSSIQHAGLPWELGLAETQQVLVQNDLRGRIRVQVDGGLRTGRDVVVGALLGAEEFGFATAALVSLGCIMLRKCHLNTCSVGIATQDEELVERFAGDPVHAMRFMLFMAEEVRELMSRLGFRTMDEMIGRVDLLAVRGDLDHWKARTLDLSAMLARPRAGEGVATRQLVAQDHGVAGHLDETLLQEAAEVLADGGRVELAHRISNGDRTVGAMLSGRIARAHGTQGLPDDSVHVRFEGSAGQSFGAFLARGVTFDLVGDANDYVGKGLSGGRIVVSPPSGALFKPEDNIIAGNVCLYGATGGELYVRGVAGERFAVRNSGARAVVEGLGDHGCEYMTGGVVVCLGPVGRNFAAGMSGGMAFVYDPTGTFRDLCNLGMVELEALVDEGDLMVVSSLVQAHFRHTGSALAGRILDNWEVLVPSFVKVMPTEYKRVLQQRRAQRSAVGKTSTTPGGARSEVAHG